MKTKEKLIFRGYRITKEQDKFLKSEAKRLGVGESAYLREIIEGERLKVKEIII